MRKKTLCATASALLTLAPAALLAQAEIVMIPFESVPGDTAFAVGTGEPIELQADTEVAGDLGATGQVASDTGFRFPDGSVQVTAGAGTPGATANAGLYSNTIADFSPPNAFTEVCVKGGGVLFDIRAAGEPTAGGNCVPGDTGWIIERSERNDAGGVPWVEARMDCLRDGMRLPEPFEWQFSCFNDSDFAMIDMKSGSEWGSNSVTLTSASSFVGIEVPVLGIESCIRGRNASIANITGTSGTAGYRCVR